MDKYTIIDTLGYVITEVGIWAFSLGIQCFVVVQLKHSSLNHQIAAKRIVMTAAKLIRSEIRNLKLSLDSYPNK